MRGVVYIASGDPFIEQCKKSLDSLRQYHDDIPVCVITNDPWEDDRVDEWVVADLGSDFRVKPENIKRSPWDETLFLDTDLRIVGDLSDIWSIKCDVSGVSIIGDLSEPGRAQVNTGVLLFRDSETVRIWDQFIKKTDSYDQQAFMRAIESSDDQFIPMAPKYNIHDQSWVAWHGDPKIIHSHKDIDSIVKRGTGKRLCYRMWDRSSVFPPQDHVRRVVRGIRSLLF